MGKRASATPTGAAATESGEATSEAPAKKVTRAKAPAKPKAAKKAATKPANKRANAAPAPKRNEDEIKHRTYFGKGWLAESIEKLFRKVEAGANVKGLEKGTRLTVNKIRTLVANSAGDPPSTGAVSAVLDRWSRDGYIKVTAKPTSFDGFTARYTAAKGGSLEKFLGDTRDAKKKERQARKAA